MKTKLLKKIRREYRIVQNELDEVWIEKRMWSHIPLYVNMMDGWEGRILTLYENCKSYDDIMRVFKKHIHDMFSKYSRKEKINKIKKNNVSVVWYGKNR